MKRVGDQQDEYEVVDRELADLALAEEPQGDQQRYIREDCSQYELPPGEGRQEE
ncbi:MAG: hypothetical protein WB682_14685 [Candidatus Dormiibacterota bacterium]